MQAVTRTELELSVARMDRDDALARAEAAEKRVAELEAKHEADLAYGPCRYAAGIRQGLERAAKECVRVGCDYYPEDVERWDATNACARAIRRLEDGVK